jgi:predicted nucleotidyltransferase
MRMAEAREILKRHADLFRRAYIFGSVARGTEDAYSDLDLILIRDTSLPFFDRIREVKDVLFALAPLDILIYSDEEFGRLLQEPGRYFLKEIAQKGEVIEGTQGGSAPVAASGGE